jgi:tRNA A-37 threonylcarbamoyl transferase component Bud32
MTPMPPIPTFRVIRAAKGEDGPAWAAALADPAWRDRATLLKSDGPTTVYRTRLLGRDTVVKCWRLGPKARIQALFNDTRALRHWRGASRLLACNIPTAAPWAMVRVLSDSHPVECLAMESLPGKTLLRHLADHDLSPRQEHALADALGRQLSLMARSSIDNRDHKPSNLIVTNPGPDHAAVAIIDCGALGPKFRSGRILATLAIEPIGVGLLPRRALMMRVIRECARTAPDQFGQPERPARRRLWHAAALAVKNHGDPTPTVNPLN